MKTVNKVKGTAVSMPAGIAAGTLLSLAATGITVAILTWMVLDGKISESSVGYYSLGILVICPLLGALLSGARIKRRWMLVCCITGTVYFVALFLCTAIFFGGQYRGLGVTAIMVLLGSLAAGLMGLKRGKVHSLSVKKYRTR